MIGNKEYKAHLTVTLLTADGEPFEQDITLIMPGEGKTQVEERLRGMQASVTLKQVNITSVHHVGRGGIKHDD
ncbi:MAG: hypothetical protein HN529_11190 [Acidiferrobacteraceae bacterium]|nr:hypothetical protein [Acidiferrobacteraceae bacterium]